jgi:hypothetical protein
MIRVPLGFIGVCAAASLTSLMLLEAVGCGFDGVTPDCSDAATGCGPSGLDQDATLGPGDAGLDGEGGPGDADTATDAQDGG